MKRPKKHNSTALNRLVSRLLNAPWKPECSTRSPIACSRPSLTVIAAVLLRASASPASFGQNAGIVPPGSTSYGHSYGEWTEIWWQWALSIPAANNPVLDSTGEFAGVGQSGPVWFLGSTFGGSERRTFTMPANKAVFLPVYQWIFGACVGDCRPSNPGVKCDVAALQASAAAATTSVKEMEVSIDGKTVNQIRDYRAFSPGSFSITLPDGNVPELFGLPTPAGTYKPQVADGYWLMLTPLDAGKHVINVHVKPDPNYGSSFSVSYQITVQP